MQGAGWLPERCIRLERDQLFINELAKQLVAELRAACQLNPSSGRVRALLLSLCYIGRVPTNWWPHRVLGALWTRRPMVNVAMGCSTEAAIVHIAHVLQKLHFFQFSIFFTNNLHALPQKKITRIYCKKKQTIFLNLHDLLQQKNDTNLPPKKITRLDDFFVHELHFSLSGVPGQPLPQPMIPQLVGQPLRPLQACGVWAPHSLLLLGTMCQSCCRRAHWHVH